MQTPTRTSVLAALAALAALATAAAPAAQSALLRRAGDLYAVPVAGTGIRAAVERLLAGPTPAQRAAGIATRIPAGTRLLGLRRAGGAVTLTLSEAFLAAVPRAGQLEDAVEQLAKTALRNGAVHAVHLAVRGAGGQDRPLAAFLDEPPLPAPAERSGSHAVQAAGFGALQGKTVAVSPGHGYYWHSTLGWTTQRPLIDGLIEDIHTGEIANRYLIPALENMGARVISCRERGEIRFERLGDNDLAGFVTSGAWGTFTGGYLNRTYQTAWAGPGGTATATWTLAVPADGIYPVYVIFPRIGNPSRGARYTIHHSGGATAVELDQSRHDLRWTHLGDFSFTRAGGARIELGTDSPVPAIVVADAVRIGGGLGSIARGGGTSGKVRWQECSRYWTQFAGAPPSVYDTSTGQDNNDDVTARPRYAEWRGADAFLSLHTNAGGGTGTSSFIYNGTPSPGSAALQSAVHRQIVGDIRSNYDASWTDRGQRQANFGEVRLLRSMPGVLLELAFHDTAGSKDHRALHDPRFRRIGGEACARGVLRYFTATAPFPPAPPVGLRVTQAPNRGLTVAWEPMSAATHYTVEASPDGKGFVEVGQANTPIYTTAPLPHGTVRSFRVRAWNGSGRSFPTEVLTAGTSHTKRAELLLVQGFDRLGRYVKAPENTFDYLRLHGAAIRTAAEFSLGFDAATNEAVGLGRVRLADYRAVDWAAGEESTADETFSFAEQGLVRNYLNGGGRLLLSGAEIGWDLWAKGTATDQAFYGGTLGARYVQDDAHTHAFRPAAGNHIFTGLPAATFDDGTGGTYDVDYADVIGPADGNSTLCLVYGSGTGAAIQRVAGASRLVYLGFPLETITDPSVRAEVMRRALRFLLAPRALEADASVTLGSTLTLSLTDPAAAGRAFVLGASAQLGAIPLPVDHLVPLFPDPVLDLSLQPNPIFVGFRGALDAGGRATARFVVPNLPIVRGVAVHVSGVTADASGAIRGVLPWVRIVVR